VRVAIDLETTGLQPESDAIIEIGALKFAGDEVLDTFETLVAPGVAIPYRVQRLTGITAEKLRGAPPLAEVLPRLRSFLGELPLVGHSVPFDAAFLRRAGLARRNRLVDTYELASALLPGLPSYTLAGVGAALGVVSPTYHRALADAQLSRDVFLALLRRLHGLDASTLMALGGLAVSPEWTPGYFVHQALRERHISLPNASGGGGRATIGDMLAAKLDIDPVVLSLAVARDAGDTPDATQALAVGTGEGPEVALGEAGTRLRQSITAHVREGLTAGGVSLVEAQNEDDGLIACLVAALEWLRDGDGTMVVSAANGEGIERLRGRVLPRAFEVTRIAPESIAVAQVEDQESYACLHRWFGAARASWNGTLSRELSRGLARLAVWLPETQSGSAGEVALGGQDIAGWDRVRAGEEFADSSAKCSYRREGYCFMARAEEAGKQARLVLTTHRALAAHLAGNSTMLPDARQVMVVDAHLLEEELRQAQSGALAQRELLGHLAALAEVGAHGERGGLLYLAAHGLEQRGGTAHLRNWCAQVERAQQAAERFFLGLHGLLVEAKGDPEGSGVGESPEQRTLRLDADAQRLLAWDEVTRAWEALAGQLTNVSKLAREVAQSLVKARGAKASAASDGVATDLLGYARRFDAARMRGDALLRGGADANTVAWLRVPYGMDGNGQGRSEGNGRGRGEGNRRNRAGRNDTAQGHATSSDGVGEPEALEAPVLYSAPVRVGERLAPLWRPGHGLVLAAPALAVGGDFAYARGTLGLPETTQAFGPEMERGEQTLLCLPDDVPEPNAPQFQRRLDEALIALATTLEGRLVAIFPSHAALRSSAQGIRKALERRNILVLAQGQDGSARQLWHTFRSEQRVVLLGAGAFWEGAEQTVAPPTCVVVTRVPFPALSDPLLAARAERWSDPQNQFVTPHAALKLRYALGGLAWSHTRRNAVVLFDKRLQTRDYGSVILGTLPRCTNYQEPMAQITERVAEWVN
jgi:DNA polymerase III epsilon subunit family exonuclease